MSSLGSDVASLDGCVRWKLPLTGERTVLVDQHPTRERLRGQLMLALYGSGRSTEALAVYRDGRSTLVDELGIEPGPDLTRLHEAILRSDPDVLARVRPQSPVHVAPAPRTLPALERSDRPVPTPPAHLPPDPADSFAGCRDRDRPPCQSRRRSRCTAHPAARAGGASPAFPEYRGGEGQL